MKTFEELKQAVTGHKYVTEEGWFFPGDIYPHSAKFKYACNKYYEKGLLERDGSPRDRWGYTYRIINP